MTAPRKIFDLEHDGDALIAVPLRNLGSLAEEELQAELPELLQALHRPDARHLVLDFSRISYFGSSMLEAVRRLARQAHAHGGRTALCGLSPVAREILEIARFDTLWPLCETREDALAAVRKT